MQIIHTLHCMVYYVLYIPNKLKINHKILKNRASRPSQGTVNGGAVSK